MLKNWFRKRSAPAIPDAAWQAALRRYPFLSARPADELGRLHELAAEFLHHKEFHGAHGFTITDEVALTIAAQAVLPVLHLPGGLAWYDDFIGIVVHPDEALAPRKVMDEAHVMHEYTEVVAGEAMDQGPIMLSWKDVLAGSHGTSHPGDENYNVVIHEFVHKIDLRDGAADGCPPLPAGFSGTSTARAARSAWFSVLEPAFDALREQSIIAERFGGHAPWLDPYGAESHSEFFAVACEAYFSNRTGFAWHMPTLLALFDQFFLNQPFQAGW